MKVAVLYYSQYGNTKLVAETIADVLSAYADVTLLEMSGLSRSLVDDASLIIVGAPTHKMNLPEKVRNTLSSLPRGILKGKACAVFDTSYEMSRWLRPFTAAPRLAKAMKKAGGKMVVPPERFLIEHDHHGPLQAGELARAHEWAHRIAEQIHAPRGRISTAR
jgi:flavodoxin